MTKKKNTLAVEPWKNRIVGYGESDAEQLLANEANWRIHPRIQQNTIGAILGEVGWVQNVIVNKRTSPEWGPDQNVETLVDGHLRVEMAISRNERVPITYVDLTPNEERLILASIDPISALAATDGEKLTALIRTINSTNDDTLAALDAIKREYNINPPASPLEGDSAIDKADALLDRWQVERGQVWQIGNHRLLCGDSTNPVDLTLLMGDDRADCLWTDPPYGVGYGDKNKKLNKTDRGHRIEATIENDDLSEADTGEILYKAMKAAYDFSTPGAACYVASPPGPLHIVFIAAMEKAGFGFHQMLIWVKSHFVIGRSDYHYRHEPILYGWKNDGAHYFVDDHTLDSIFTIDKPNKSDLHPTMKPVELVVNCIRNSAVRGGIVLDPFGGSGTTMLACQQLGMQCRMVETEPRYCAVILERLSLIGLQVELVK